MPELKPLQSGYYIWKYVPSIPLSVIALLLWLVTTCALSWRMFKTRTWFCTYLVVGCFMEVIGYGARAASANRTDSLGTYCIQATFILLPPIFFAATIYICLGRLIRLVQGDHLSLVKPARLTRTFVICDIVSFFVQGNSTPFTVLADKNPIFPKLGQALVLLGLAIQLVAFCVFSYVAFAFHRRLKIAPTQESYEFNSAWVTIMRMLYTTSALIIIRSVFRLIEFAAGAEGYLLVNEWPLYAFDTIPMLAVCIIFSWYHPASLAGVGTKDKEEIVELGIRDSGQQFFAKR